MPGTVVSMPYIGVPVTIRRLSTPLPRVPMILKSFGSLSLTWSSAGGVRVAALASSPPYARLRRLFAWRTVPALVSHSDSGTPHACAAAVTRTARRPAPRCGSAFLFGPAPRLRGGGDQHGPARRADPAHRVPVVGRRGAASRVLILEVHRVESRLLDPDVLPLHVELVGDDHREHRLDALPDFRILRHDRDGAVGCDPDPRVERAILGGRARRRRRPPPRVGPPPPGAPPPPPPPPAPSPRRATILRRRRASPGEIPAC